MLPLEHSAIHLSFIRLPAVIKIFVLSIFAGQKYCRMLKGEHSAKHLPFIRLPFVIKIFVLSIFERLLKCFTQVLLKLETRRRLSATPV